MAKTDKTKLERAKKADGNVKLRASKRSRTISKTMVISKKTKTTKKFAVKSAFAAYQDETKEEPMVEQEEPKRTKENRKKLKKRQCESIATTPELIKLEQKETPEIEMNESYLTEDLEDSSADSPQLTSISVELNESCMSEDADIPNQIDIGDEEPAKFEPGNTEANETPCHEQEFANATSSLSRIEEVNDGDMAILHLTPDSLHVLLAVHEDHSGIKIFGQGAIRAVKGCGEILGHKLRPGADVENFYAPMTHCALVIQPLKKEFLNPDTFTNIALCGIDLSENIRERVQELSDNFGVIFLISSLNEQSGFVSFAEYPSIFQVRKSDEVMKHVLNPGSYVVTTDRAFKEYPSYHTTITTLLADLRLCKSDRSTQQPIIVTCGGKNSGKSTFNRYLINKLLRECDRVCFLECDVGQTEFTPSGMLSLVSVSKPLLGPPFTHQATPDFAVYYGDASPARDPDRYVRSVRRVFEEFDHSCPLVVNTMGWTKALGLHLLVDSIRITRPTQILQLVSQKPSRNLPLLTPEYVANAEGWLCHGGTYESPNHKLLTMNVEIHIFEKMIYRPSDMRDLAFISYLNKTVYGCLAKRQKHETQLPSSSMTALCSVQPYVVNLADVTLCVAHRSGVRRTHALAAFNASAVGLCISTNKQTEESEFLPGAPVCPCLGLGIVRGVDPQKEVLYVVSQLMPEEMNRVNCLVLGALCIPESLFQGGPNKECPRDMPYVLKESWFDVTGSNKFRTYRNYPPSNP